jgi:hypothetical protein
MPGRTLLQVRDFAKQIAEQRGHKIKRWNSRRPFRYTAICSSCRANLVVYSQIADGMSLPELSCKRGLIVARDRDLYWTERDYNWARGSALTQQCYGQ